LIDGSLPRILLPVRESDWLPLIDLALREDLAEEGDVTSRAIFRDEQRTAALWSKDTGVLAGEEVFAAVFRRLDPAVQVTFHLHDGARLSKGDRVAEVSGPVRSILSAERTAINFIAFMSGIATAARRLSDLAAGSGHAVILDTRKTLPGWRALSKYAVATGGGTNHRIGLFDMVLVKDNHIDAAGSITEAVARVRRAWGRRFKVEVECRTTAEVEEALAAGADILMLDNMDTATMREAVRRASGRASIEASGNMSAEGIPEVSATGVDSISVGSLTHSVRSFDFSLKIGGPPAGART
jgi:nicotinate-nucleotide pyrophosphorylase (carboxylating)